MVTQILRPVGGVVVIGGTWVAARNINRVEKDDSSFSANEAVNTNEIKSLAETVFGNTDDADEWLNKPAVALNGRSPVDLLTTRSGAVLVKDLLIRLEYCVYV